MRRPVSLLSLVLAASLWVAALVAAPSAASGSAGPLSPGFAAVIYAAGSIVCHQRPERSFHRDGVRLPVCARCVGLYTGGALGVLAWAMCGGIRRRPSARARHVVASSLPKAVLIAVSVPTALTVLTAMLGVWDPANLTRAVLGGLLGCAIGAVVAAVAAGDLR